MIYFISLMFLFNRYFPHFDLVHLTSKQSLIRDLLDKNSNLRRLFSDTFISHFTQFKTNH